MCLLKFFGISDLILPFELILLLFFKLEIIIIKKRNGRYMKYPCQEIDCICHSYNNGKEFQFFPVLFYLLW